MSAQAVQDALINKSCVDCGIAAPKEESDHTPISSKYGWRLACYTTTDGRKKMQWRCPECWVVYRDKTRSVPRSAASLLRGRLPKE
jgi:hypothetical protein